MRWLSWPAAVVTIAGAVAAVLTTSCDSSPNLALGLFVAAIVLASFGSASYGTTWPGRIALALAAGIFALVGGGFLLVVVLLAHCPFTL